jgi:hypothetical protein
MECSPLPNRHLSANVEMRHFHKPSEATKMNITTIGIDLAKNVIQVHSVERSGKAVLKKAFKREQVVGYFANLPPA